MQNVAIDVYGGWGDRGGDGDDWAGCQESRGPAVIDHLLRRAARDVR